MSRRVSGPAFFSTRLTTLAGSSSSMSTASSTYSSSTMAESSWSVADWIMVCWVSGGRLENTSAASSLGSVRKATTAFSWGSSARASATSTSFSSASIARRAW